MPNTPQSVISCQDFLNGTNFVVVVDKFKGIVFFTNEVTIPGMSLEHPLQPNPFADIKRVGDRIQYDQLSLNFKVNEDLSNWRELVDWMRGVTFPDNYDQYRLATSPSEKEASLFTDITVTVLSNFKKPILNLVFKNCLPASLGGFTFSSTDTDIATVGCDISFNFEDIDIVPV